MSNFSVEQVKNVEPASKFEYCVAKKIADSLIETLEPFCEKIHVAGSIRRQKPLVKDIEIVCEPQRVFFQTELFGNGEHLVIPKFRNAVKLVSEYVIRGGIDGRYAQIRLKAGITLDMFLPQPHDYFRQLATRTGSGDYSRFIIAAAWLKNGWCGTADGLRKTSECTKEGNKWKCYRNNPELPPVWQSEEEFFGWIGAKYVEPAERNV